MKGRGGSFFERRILDSALLHVETILMKKGKGTMKNVKRIAITLMVLVFTLSMTAAAFAEEVTKGTITINGVKDTNVYEIYQLLELESYDKKTGAYAYKVNSAWTAFFETSEAQEYLTVDNDGYVTWTGPDAESDVAAFAKKALAFAKANSIEPVQSSMDEGKFVITEGNGKFSDLPLGYYLVDSTMGALCGLTTTNPDASIVAKNSSPTIDKMVQEDSTNQWGSKNTADIGQTVKFRTTINVHAGAENYVLHDEMSAGLTLDPASITIKHVVPGQTDEEGTTVPVDYYTVETAELDDGCTFEVIFTPAFCDHLETNDKVIVFYSAVLNENAVVGGEGNVNESWLDYGDKHSTTHDSTTTKTFSFDIIKTDSQNTLIDGAEFVIYDAATGGNQIHVRADLEVDGRVREYIITNDASQGVNIVVEKGAVRVNGFDNGTYYLEEVKAPDGFNKLSSRQRFIIADGNISAIFNGENYSVGSGVHVVNKSGTMLPETGGIGTTIFYTVGGMMVAAAVVLMVTRRRMNEK